MKTDPRSLLSKPIFQFSLQEIEDLRQFVNDSQRYDLRSHVSGNVMETAASELHDRYEKLRKEEIKKFHRQALLKRRNKAERDSIEVPVLNKFALSLKVGDLVKFRGTRGSPFRQVDNVLKYEDGYGSKRVKIVGWVMQRICGSVLERTTYASDNDASNLTGWFDKVSQQWLDHKEIMEIAKSL